MTENKGEENMAYSNSSAAYDLAEFEQLHRQPKPELKVISSQKRGQAASLISLRAFGAFAVIVVLVILMIYNQVQLNEATRRVNTLTTQLNELESEYTRMSSDLEATQSLRMIADQAQDELGMSRLDKYQTTYICLEQEDCISLTENAPDASFGQRVEMKVQAVIARIQEYIAD